MKYCIILLMFGNICGILAYYIVLRQASNTHIFFTGGITLAKTKSDLIRDNELEKMSETLKAVAHPVRLQIVNILMKGERSVGDLVKTLGTKQSLTSQQLSILKSRGVLKSRRNGNVVYYSLENSGVKNIMSTILQEIA